MQAFDSFRRNGGNAYITIVVHKNLKLSKGFKQFDIKENTCRRFK